MNCRRTFPQSQTARPLLPGPNCSAGGHYTGSSGRAQAFVVSQT